MTPTTPGTNTETDHGNLGLCVSSAPLRSWTGTSDRRSTSSDSEKTTPAITRNVNWSGKLRTLLEEMAEI